MRHIEVEPIESIGVSLGQRNRVLKWQRDYTSTKSNNSAPEGCGVTWDIPSCAGIPAGSSGKNTVQRRERVRTAVRPTGMRSRWLHLHLV